MTNHNRIAKASRRMGSLLAILMALIPTACAVFWLLVNQIPTIQDKFPGYVLWPLPVTTRLLCFVVCMLTAGVAMYGVLILMRLFRLYEAGSIFTSANVACFRSLAKVLMWWCGAGILQDPLLGLSLTAHNPPGQHVLAIGLTSPDLTALMIGAFLAIIAWVMEEARRLQEEQDLTV